MQKKNSEPNLLRILETYFMKLPVIKHLTQL